MCGICGFFQAGPEADAAVLKRMCGRIVHRGPDDEGLVGGEGTGLAVRRLSIIDPASGHQPLASASGGSWIAYNGEVYNFPELRRELAGRGYDFRTRSDTEVVVNLYEEYGLDFVRRLRGMFALAIHDRRNRRLVLARDPIGKKPLYYHVTAGGGVVFASEIKALLEFPGLARDMDPEAVDLFLTLEYVPAPLSILKAVRKLPAGHLLVCENGRVALHEYWDVRPGRSRLPLSRARDEFLGLMEESVRLRMISDVPLGAFLSGGIDSSSVVAFMARLSPSPIRTFAIGFDEASYSELPYARQAAERFGTDHQERTLGAGIHDLVLQVAAGLDEPLADFSNFPTLLVSRLAREKVKVVLTGDGGDEIFGGYEHFRAQRLARCLAPAAFRPLRGLAAAAALRLPPSGLKKGLVSRLKRFGGGLSFSPRNRHLRWMMHWSAAQKALLYEPGFLRESFLLDLPDREPFRRHFERGRDFPGIDQDLYLDLKTYLADDILVKVDRMSMAASLEARAPLLDVRLVEFAFSLPAAWKVRGGTGKWFLKEAMAGILDPRTIRRRKEGFSIPMKNWLRTELRRLMLETLSEERVRSLGFLSYPAVRSLVEEHLARRDDHSHRLWGLVQLLLWHDRFGRVRPPSP